MPVINGINSNIYNSFITSKASAVQTAVGQESVQSAPIASAAVHEADCYESQSPSLPTGAKVAITAALAALAGVGIYVWRRGKGGKPPVKQILGAKPPVVQPSDVKLPGVKPAEVQAVGEQAAETVPVFKDKLANSVNKLAKKFGIRNDHKNIGNSKTLIVMKDSSNQKPIAHVGIMDKNFEYLLKGKTDANGNLAEYTVYRGHELLPGRVRSWRSTPDGEILTKYAGAPGSDSLIKEIKLT
ncbi:MAG: hypothetical protein PHX18_05680 [Candidatus Gastranaerophilales bacterium]|nr:hypothetical protein [Candidatus Gastranaerophilales bacterium]